MIDKLISCCHAPEVFGKYKNDREMYYFFSSAPEPQILDYVTQQYKLFPLLAACFAFHYSAEWIWNMYNNVTEDIDKGQLGNLPEVIKLCSFFHKVYKKIISFMPEWIFILL